MTFSAIQTSVRVTNANSSIELIIFPNDLQSTLLSYRQWKCSSFIASVGSSISKSQLKVYVPTIHQQRRCIEHRLWSWPLLYTVQWAHWRAICFDERLEMNISFFIILYYIHYIFIQINAAEHTTELGNRMNIGFVLHHSLMLALKVVHLHGFCVFKHIITQDTLILPPFPLSYSTRHPNHVNDYILS